jgi:hypothetical protein
MSPETLETQVLTPMQAAGLFNVAETKVFNDKMRGQYRGQLPRVALTVFDVSGEPCGIVLTYHDKFKPDLSQYEAWSNFWHARQLAQAQDSQGAVHHSARLSGGRYRTGVRPPIALR